MSFGLYNAHLVHRLTVAHVTHQPWDGVYLADYPYPLLAAYTYYAQSQGLDNLFDTQEGLIAILVWSTWWCFSYFIGAMLQISSECAKIQKPGGSLLTIPYDAKIAQIQLDAEARIEEIKSDPKIKDKDAQCKAVQSKADKEYLTKYAKFCGFHQKKES